MKTSASPFKRYNNSRHNLILVFILSLLNMFLYAGTRIYFLFSAYLPLMLIDIADTDSRLIGFMLIFSFSYLTAYLLCYIFSKRRLGWMIAALSLFSIDSICLLINVPAHFAAGDFLIILDLLFHFYVFGSLVMGTIDGKNLKPILASNGRNSKSQPIAESMQSKKPSGEEIAESIKTEESAQTDVFEKTRTLTIQRKKAFIGCIVPFLVCVNGKVIGTLKNGQKAVFTVSTCAFNLSVVLTNGSSENSIEVEEGDTPLTFETSTNAGFTSTKLELNQIE